MVATGALVVITAAVVVAETAGPVVVGTTNETNASFVTFSYPPIFTTTYNNIQIHRLRNQEYHGHILPGPAVLVATPAVVVTTDGGCVVPDGGGVGVTGC